MQNARRQGRALRYENELSNCVHIESRRPKSTHRSRVYSDLDLHWHANAIRLGTRELARLVPDDLHPQMWRVKTSASLSDIVNTSRARDAARCLALAALNSDAQETCAGGSSINLQAVGAQ